MNLVVVRHGETVENVNRIIQGNSGGTLSDKGVEQAKRLALELKDEKFDQIYSSDLARAVNTAKPIMKFYSNLELKLTPAIREMSFGQLQGDYSKLKDWDSIPGPLLKRKFPGGESTLEMYQRVIDLVNDLFSKFPDQKILLVTHGGPIRAIRSAYNRTPILDLYDLNDVANTSIWRFDINKPLRLYNA